MDDPTTMSSTNGVVTSASVDTTGLVYNMTEMNSTIPNNIAAMVC